MIGSWIITGNDTFEKNLDVMPASIPSIRDLTATSRANASALAALEQKFARYAKGVNLANHANLASAACSLVTKFAHCCCAKILCSQYVTF